MGRGTVIGSWQDLLFFPPTNRSNDKNLYWTKLGGVVVFRGTILKNVVFHPWKPGVDWTQKIFLCPIRDKHSNESWNWFVNSSIPGVISPVLENFRRRFSAPGWPPLGLQGWVFLSINNLFNCFIFVNFALIRQLTNTNKWIFHQKTRCLVR